ncbi:MAG: hypothetical protein ACLSGI_07625 [Butyricicoccaceae bacterium]
MEDTTINGSVKNIELQRTNSAARQYRRCAVRKKLQDYLPPILLKTYEFPLLWRPSSRRLTVCMMPLMRCSMRSF